MWQFVDWKIRYRCKVSSHTDARFNTASVKTPAGHLVETGKPILKFTWKCKGLRPKHLQKRRARSEDEHCLIQTQDVRGHPDVVSVPDRRPSGRGGAGVAWETGPVCRSPSPLLSTSPKGGMRAERDEQVLGWFELLLGYGGCFLVSQNFAITAVTVFKNVEAMWEGHLFSLKQEIRSTLVSLLEVAFRGQQGLRQRRFIPCCLVVRW